MIVEHKWAYPFIGSVLIIFSIQFSPDLRRILSHRFLVFYGGISFSLFLMHGFMMRWLLSWVINGFLPQETYWRYLLNTIAFGLWISLVTSLALVWRNKFENRCREFAEWLQEVMVGGKKGPRTLLDTGSSVGHMNLS